MEALEAQMTGAVTDTDPARQCAVVVAAAVAVDTLPLRMMITTIAAALLEATAPVATTIADALPRASFTTDVKEVMEEDVARLVDGFPMSMAHRARATLTRLTMPGPDLHPVVLTMIRT